MGLERIWIFLLLPLTFLLILMWRQDSFLRFPSLQAISNDFWGGGVALSFRVSSFLLLFLLLFLAAGLRVPLKESGKYAYGADIVFVLDESGSMNDPFGMSLVSSNTPGTPTIFTAAKSVISKFVQSRRNGRDRYGLTIFGTSAVRVLPLTFNRDLFLHCLESQEVILESTMLFQALSVALEELSFSAVRSRIIVFVSDGVGILSDEKYQFSDFVRKQGIRFYWVDLGQEAGQESGQEIGREMYDFINGIGLLGRRLDASNPTQLEAGLAEIDKLERSPIIVASSGWALSPIPLVYAAFLMGIVLWATYSLFVYRRRR